MVKVLSMKKTFMFISLSAGLAGGLVFGGDLTSSVPTSLEQINGINSLKIDKGLTIIGSLTPQQQAKFDAELLRVIHIKKCFMLRVWGEAINDPDLSESDKKGFGLLAARQKELISCSDLDDLYYTTRRKHEQLKDEYEKVGSELEKSKKEFEKFLQSEALLESQLAQELGMSVNQFRLKGHASIDALLTADMNLAGEYLQAQGVDIKELYKKDNTK